MDNPQSNDDVLFRIAIVTSVLAGLSLAYVVFFLFLQTSVISLSRLAAAFAVLFLAAGANYFLILHILKERLEAFLQRGLFSAILCILLPLLFLPEFFVPPAYPVHPLLRQWTDLAVQFDVNANSRPLAFSNADVRLQMDKDVLDAQSFRAVGIWKSAKDTFRLDPGMSATLQWVGPASDSMLLTLLAPAASGSLTIYWDQARSVFELSPDSPKQILLVRKFSTPWGVGALLFAAIDLLTTWLLLIFMVLLHGNLGISRLVTRLGGSRVLLLILVVALAVLTVELQLDSLNGGAASYIQGAQLERHNAVLSGQAPNPWQYRVLSEYVAEGLIRLFQLAGVPDAAGFGFISLRLLQNIAIFLGAFILFRKISASKWIALLGMLILAASMARAFYDNDLSFNTYFDLLFYLLSVILIVDQKYYWVVPLTALAALNRETSGLIPFLLLAALVQEEGPLRKKFLPFLFAAASFAVIFFGLRILYPVRPLYIPYDQAPGYPLLIYNVTRSFTWEQLFYTLGFVPGIGLLWIFTWPRLWQRFFLVLVPVWFAIHFVLSVVGETRLFLVPQAVLFIPGIIFVLKHLQKQETTHGSPSLASS